MSERDRFSWNRQVERYLELYEAPEYRRTLDTGPVRDGGIPLDVFDRHMESALRGCTVVRSSQKEQSLVMSGICAGILIVALAVWNTMHDKNVRETHQRTIK